VRRPSPGWSGQYEWGGKLDFDDMPSAFNPADGLWANANHDTSRLSPRHFFTREYIDSARYRRIRQVLESKPHHSAVDFGALQADEVSLPAREVAALLVAHVRAPTGLSICALDELRAWDGQVSSDSVAATVYEVFRNELLKARHGDELGDLLPAILGHGPHPLLAAVTSHYFLQTGRVLSFLRASPDDPIVQTAFDNSIAWLRRTLGPRVNTWQWGRLHPLRLQHALSLRKPLGMVFDVPGFPWSGDLETVRAGGSAAGRYEASGPISAYRLIADCGDWDNTLSCVPGGQSGHRGSPHYADQIEAWRRVAYHPLSFTRPAIARQCSPRQDDTAWARLPGGAAQPRPGGAARAAEPAEKAHPSQKKAEDEPLRSVEPRREGLHHRFGFPRAARELHVGRDRLVAQP